MFLKRGFRALRGVSSGRTVKVHVGKKNVFFLSLVSVSLSSCYSLLPELLLEMVDGLECSKGNN